MISRNQLTHFFASVECSQMIRVSNQIVFIPGLVTLMEVLRCFWLRRYSLVRGDIIEKMKNDEKEIPLLPTNPAFGLSQPHNRGIST